MSKFNVWDVVKLTGTTLRIFREVESFKYDEEKKDYYYTFTNGHCWYECNLELVKANTPTNYCDVWDSHWTSDVSKEYSEYKEALWDKPDIIWTLTYTVDYRPVVDTIQNFRKRFDGKFKDADTFWGELEREILNLK